MGRMLPDCMNERSTLAGEKQQQNSNSFSAAFFAGKFRKTGKSPVPQANVIKLSENCHSEERSNVGIRQNPLKNGLPRQFANWLAMTEALT